MQNHFSKTGEIMSNPKFVAYIFDRPLDADGSIPAECIAKADSAEEFLKRFDKLANSRKPRPTIFA